jgi:hypothetical protein
MKGVILNTKPKTVMRLSVPSSQLFVFIDKKKTITNEVINH